MVYGLWSMVHAAVYGLRSMVYGLWSFVYGRPSPRLDARLWCGLWSVVYGLLSIALYGGGDIYGAANANVHADMYGAMILGNSRSESQATPSNNQLQHSTQLARIAKDIFRAF